MVLADVYMARDEPVVQLRRIDSERSLFSESMPKTRFTDIALLLPFDDAASRRQRREIDKLSSIRDVLICGRRY